MSIDKPLQTPIADPLFGGMDSNLRPIEVETITMEEPEIFDEELPDVDFDDNLAEWITEDELGELENALEEEVRQDIDSRKQWSQDYVDGLELMGMICGCKGLGGKVAGRER